MERREHGAAFREARHSYQERRVRIRVSECVHMAVEHRSTLSYSAVHIGLPRLPTIDRKNFE